MTVDSTAAPSIVQVRIKASKTDPYRKGVSLYLWKTDNDLCPVAAVTAYVAVRGRGLGPFFRLEGGAPLSRELLVKQVREVLQPRGFDVLQHSGHSFRIRAATTVAAGGTEDSLIQMLGRWHSSAYLLYVRVPRERLATLSKKLSTTEN